VTGCKGDVYIDEMDDEMDKEDEDDEEGAAVIECPRQRWHLLQQQRNQEEFCALCSQNATLQCELEVVKAQLECMSNQQEWQFNIVNNNVHRLMIQPARVIRNHPAGATPAVAGDADDGTGPGNFVAASLLPLPKTIHALWQEYEFGIGGCKAACDFNAME